MKPVTRMTREIDIRIVRYVLLVFCYVVFTTSSGHGTELRVFENENPQMSLFDKFEFASQIYVKHDFNASIWIFYTYGRPIDASPDESSKKSTPGRTVCTSPDSTLFCNLSSTIEKLAVPNSSMVFIKITPLGERVFVTDACMGSSIYTIFQPSDALYWFGKTNLNQSLSFLARSMQLALDATTKANILDLIACHPFQLDHAEIYSEIITNDYPERLKVKSIFKLAACHTLQCDSILLKFLESSNDPKSIKVIIQSLCQSENDLVIDRLEFIARNHTDISIQKEAIFSLSQSKNESGLLVLFDLFNTENDINLKKFILFALSQSDKQAAIEFLQRVESDPQNFILRKEAEFWLNNI